MQQYFWQKKGLPLWDRPYHCSQYRVGLVLLNVLVKAHGFLFSLFHQSEAVCILK